MSRLGTAPHRTDDDDGDGGASLGMRVFGAMALVIVAGAGTLSIIALLVAPAVFRQHLAEAGVAPESAIWPHVDEGFTTALLAAITSGVIAAAIVAAGLALLVARRINATVASAASTAGRLADGDYSARISPPRMGPELADLAASINALAQRLESAEQTRLALLADVAHELRTPLTSIEATVEAISDGVLPADDESLRTLREQSRRMSQLVADLSLASRADEHSFLIRTRQTDLAEVARDSAAAAAARFVASGVHLVVPATEPVLAIADPDRVAEVVGQLLDNALRACAAGDTVTVSVHAAGAGVELTVHDTGAGFEPTEAELLFERFYRGSEPGPLDRAAAVQPVSADAADPGSGIGLTIARALIAAQGGTITAASAGYGQGATFTITLPRPGV
ncbi:MAG: HAMP domain-containing sensor histidine kinase [Actinomycetes bacterium]